MPTHKRCKICDENKFFYVDKEQLRRAKRGDWRFPFTLHALNSPFVEGRKESFREVVLPGGLFEIVQV